MKDDYLILIDGKQDFYSSNDPILSVETFGRYVKRGDVRYIIYKEYDEKDPQKSSISVLKIDGEKCVTLTKNGKIKTKLILEEGVRHHCYYSTEIGCLMFGVFTDTIRSNFSDDGGELKVNYSLDVNSNLASINEITVKVRRIN